MLKIILISFICKLRFTSLNKHNNRNLLDLRPFRTRRVTGTIIQIFTFLRLDQTRRYLNYASYSGTRSTTGYRATGQCATNIVLSIRGNSGRPNCGCIPGTISRAFHAVFVHFIDLDARGYTANTQRVCRYPGTHATRVNVQRFGVCGIPLARSIKQKLETLRWVRS